MLLIAKPKLGLGRLWALAVAAVVSVTPTWAQCAMCKAAAGSQKAAAILALNQGIILLAVPPAAIIIGIAWLTYKHRNAAGIQQAPEDRHKPLY